MLYIILDIASKSNEERKETIIENMIHRSTSISPERIFNSPTKVRLREFHAREMKTMKRKLSIAEYKNRKLQTKVQSLKNLLKELQKKNLVTTEDILPIDVDETD